MSETEAQVKIPLYLYCHHKNENEYVIMKVQTLDPEVPSYLAKCPRCGKEVVFDFDGGLEGGEKHENS